MSKCHLSVQIQPVEFTSKKTRVPVKLYKASFYREEEDGGLSSGVYIRDQFLTSSEIHSFTTSLIRDGIHIRY